MKQVKTHIVLMGELMVISKSGDVAIHYGVSFGTALAIVISWSLNKPVIWACVHGLFSWFYVAYYILFK